MELTNEEYTALQNLYHNYNAAFLYLPDYIKDMYYRRLYQGARNGT